MGSYRLFGFALVLGLSIPLGFAGTYDTPAGNATTWLIQQHNSIDGSWGSTTELKYVQTSEAVLALTTMNRRTPEYYAGLTWLENHAPANVDFKARRILALVPNGANVSTDLTYLQSAQNLAAPGNSGWGLSSVYQGAALDSALTLQAYSQAGVSTNVSSGVSYLKGAQITGTDNGWAIGQETASDPATTAQVLQALIPLKSTDAALTTVIANGLAALNSKVSSASTVPQQALAALANFRNNSASTQAVTLLNNLVAVQSTDGSWGQDIYATALGIRALAAGMGRDLTAQQLAVSVPDANLRAAINLALGRNALDSLNVGEIAQLKTLTISGMNIRDLTGLQYATNLTYLDARNNQIASTSPLAGLTQLTTLLLTGNPGFGADGDINGDGVVDVADVTLADRMALGLVVPTSTQLSHGDVAPNSATDGVIDAADVARIRRKALGLETF